MAFGAQVACADGWLGDGFPCLVAGGGGGLGAGGLRPEVRGSESKVNPRKFRRFEGVNQK